MSTEESQYNEDELQPPAWLNEEFFKDIMRKREKDENLKLTSLEFQPCTTKNDHYASVIYRAKIIYELSNGAVNQKSLIIKAHPELPGKKKELLENYKHFETEIKMYSEALQKIEGVLRKYGDETKLRAHTIYHSLAPHKCIIFEDLTVEGYTMISNRHCTLEEVKAALLKLSKLHAVSFKLGKEGNKEITEFPDGSFCADTETEYLENSGWHFIVNAVPNIIKVLESHENLKMFVPYMKQMPENLLLRVVNSFNAYKNGVRDGIMVLSHGDFHLKNMLIKYREKNLEDIMLVDYQLSYFGSAATDVLYATIMLFSPEMRLNHRDELIFYYFSNFQKTLKLIEYEGQIPTMLEFQYELLKFTHWELLLTISFLMFNYQFVAADGDLAKSIEDNEYRERVWNKIEIVNELEVLLKRLLYRGAFEE